MATAIVSHGEVLRSVRDGNMRASHVARDLAIRRTTAARYLNELVERGWLTRRIASEDRGRMTVRYAHFWLTVRGHEAIRDNESW